MYGSTYKFVYESYGNGSKHKCNITRKDFVLEMVLKLQNLS